MDVNENKLLDEARAILDSNEKSMKMSDDHLICECMCISAGEIRELFREREFSLDFLCQKLKLGSGCQSCLKTKGDWVRKL